MIALMSVGVVAQPDDGDYAGHKDHYVAKVTFHKIRPITTVGWTFRHTPELEVEEWMLDENYLAHSGVPVERWMLDEKYLAENVVIEPWMLDTKYLGTRTTK